MKIVCIVIASFALFGCGSDAATSSDVAPAPVSQISITEMQFSVPENALSTDQFELTNNDAIAHNFMLLDETVSVDVAAGETVAMPAFKPGSYPFLCQIHPSMMGTLVVS